MYILNLLVTFLLLTSNTALWFRSYWKNSYSFLANLKVMCAVRKYPAQICTFLKLKKGKFAFKRREIVQTLLIVKKLWGLFRFFVCKMMITWKTKWKYALIEQYRLIRDTDEFIFTFIVLSSDFHKSNVNYIWHMTYGFLLCTDNCLAQIFCLHKIHYLQFCTIIARF